MDIVISGASGLIGSALTDALRHDGHRVISLVRRAVAPGADEIRWDPASESIDRESLEGADAVVHLAGAGIGDRRWSEARKAEIRDSRIRGTGLLARTLADLNASPGVFVCGSAIGFYGNRGDEELTEASRPGDGFLATLVEDWEASAVPASAAGIRTVCARTSVVLTDQGGALKRQLLVFKLGLGGRFGSGDQWLSWITLRDQVKALRYLIDNDISGPVNVCAPHPVTNLDFTKTLGSVLRRPTLLPIPLVGPRLLFGRELVEEVLLASQRCVPSVLMQHGHIFEDPELDSALRRLLRR